MALDLQRVTILAPHPIGQGRCQPRSWDTRDYAHPSTSKVPHRAQESEPVLNMIPTTPLASDKCRAQSWQLAMRPVFQASLLDPFLPCVRPQLDVRALLVLHRPRQMGKELAHLDFSFPDRSSVVVATAPLQGVLKCDWSLRQSFIVNGLQC